MTPSIIIAAHTRLTSKWTGRATTERATENCCSGNHRRGWCCSVVAVVETKDMPTKCCGLLLKYFVILRSDNLQPLWAALGFFTYFLISYYYTFLMIDRAPIIIIPEYQVLIPGAWYHYRPAHKIEAVSGPMYNDKKKEDDCDISLVVS